MPYPEDRRYSRSHQWALKNPDGSLTVGITDFAQAQLGDILFIQLPVPGQSVAANEPCAVVESVKSASDVQAPVAGTILEVNSALPDQPEQVNASPHDHWFFKMRPTTLQDHEQLMSAAQYHLFIHQET